MQLRFHLGGVLDMTPRGFDTPCIILIDLFSMTEEVSAQERLRVVPLIDLALPDDEAFEMLDPEGEFDFKEEFGTLEYLLQVRFYEQNQPTRTKTFADFINRAVELYNEAGLQRNTLGFPEKTINEKTINTNRQSALAGNIVDLVVIIDPQKVGYSKRVQAVVDQLGTHSLHFIFGKSLKEAEFSQAERAPDYGALGDAYQEIATGKARSDFFKGYNLL